MKITATIIFAGCLAFSTAVGAVELQQEWVLDGLSNPESVALSPAGDMLYVSNVNGEATEKNGEGFISRINLDGTVEELHWIDGLNAPKGMAHWGGRLVITDIDQLVLINAQTGEYEQAIDIPNAVFLNDAAATSAGGLVFSDSGAGVIYEISGHTVREGWQDERLAGVNGLLAYGDDILVSTMNGGELLRTNETSRELELVASGLGQADGIAVLDDGTILVSEWPGRLFAVSTDGEVETVIDSREAGVFINDFLLVGDLLIVPSWNPGRLTAYRVLP